MRNAFIVTAVALLLAGGCSKQRNETTSNSMLVDDAFPARTTTPTPEQLGEIGAKINKQPGEAQKILRDYGLTLPAYQQAVQKASQDPTTLLRISQAYKRAGV